MLRILRGVLIALGVLVLIVGGALAFCALSYWQDMRIATPNGIAEARYVKIGGIDQWVQIRGRDRNNPALLWLNGGPGFTTIGDTYDVRDWEKDFTIVMWDQRGEGKTFARSGTSVAKTMSIAQMTSDGIELAQYLARRLHKDKIILLGHSWGSMLGVHMVHERPDLFYAYVGTGQLTGEQQSAIASYPLLLARARAQGNKLAEQELIAAGAPPYSGDVRKWVPWLLWAQALDPPSAEKSPPSAARLWIAVRGIFKPREMAPGITPAVQFSMISLWSDILKDDLPALGLRFDVPIVFIQGAEDITTVTALAKDYFDKIEAPSKQFILIEGAGHLALFRAHEKFLHALVDHVRPLAIRGADEDTKPK